jgi:hypothetical protein
MLTVDTTVQRPDRGEIIRQRILPQRAVLAPAALILGLMLVWAAHNGGYDADTWYWGALLVLGLLAITLIGLGRARRSLSRASLVALSAFGAYTAWSYLSMAWAQTPGWALEGSNRTVLYLLIFAVFAVLPWRPEAALAALAALAVGIGVIAIVLLVRLASANHLQTLLDGGRLVSPTGYFNSSVALFMTNALVATALASRRELPGLLRGLLTAIAGASLQLCILGQSRGWLFTLPFVLLIVVVLVPDRLRLAATAALPLAGALASAHGLLQVFQDSDNLGALSHAARAAGRLSLLICVAIFVVGTLIAWADRRSSRPPLTGRTRRAVGVVVGLAAVLLASGGAVAATHGDPVGFVKRQWHGFVHSAPATVGSGSHFGAVGSGRYDFWRVSLDAFTHHPLGGLGQDNFADYYVTRRRTFEEPRWTHSIEMRLLTHTGIVGFGLFAVFVIAAVAAALPARRRGNALTRAAVAISLLPMVVWLVHGSVDWFWEMPALTGPAVGFLALAGALGDAERRQTSPRAESHRIPTVVRQATAAVALVAAAVVLGFPYLSVREASVASDIGARDPGAALSRLTTAADLNPLSPDPTRLGGTIALQSGQLADAEKRFRQTIQREPGGWFGWLGAGLAASALGDSEQATRDFRMAASINSRQPVVQQALESVNTTHPLTPGEALRQLALRG